MLFLAQPFPVDTFPHDFSEKRLTKFRKTYIKETIKAKAELQIVAEYEKLFTGYVMFKCPTSI